MKFVFKNKKLFAFLFWAWIVLILYFSLTPNGPKMMLEYDNMKIRLDYFFHFIVYFNLAILYLFWKANNFLKVKSSLLVYFIIGGLILSGLTEYAQTFIPGRSFNLIDFYSSASGILSGAIAPIIILKKNPE